MDPDELAVRRRLAAVFSPPRPYAAPPARAGSAPRPTPFTVPAEPAGGGGGSGPPAGPPAAEAGPRRVGRPADRDDEGRLGRVADPPASGAGRWPGEPAAGAALTGIGAFDPGRRGVRVLAVVAAVVVLVAGFLAWRARPETEPVGSGPAAAEPPLVAATASASPPTELVVAVAGKVRRPGLVRVPAGARVADAIEAAGGVRPGVDVTMLNLARRVVDGELIAVGVPAPAGSVATGGLVPGGKLNLNTATVAQLDGLPGVGPVLAERIVAYRDGRAGFTSVEQLREVDGIGGTRFERLRDLVTV